MSQKQNRGFIRFGLTNAQKGFIFANYDKMEYREICGKIHISTKTLCAFLRAHGLQK